MSSINICAANLLGVFIFYSERDLKENVPQILECLKKAEYLNTTEVSKTGVLGFGGPQRIWDSRLINHSGLPPRSEI